LAGSEAASRRRRVWKGGEAASWLVLPFEKAGGDTDTGRVEWQFLHECVRTRALLPPASAYWLLLPSVADVKNRKCMVSSCTLVQSYCNWRSVRGFVRGVY
jgi:hypothetical protein